MTCSALPVACSPISDLRASEGYRRLLALVRKTPGVKHAFVSSGIRYDLLKDSAKSATGELLWQSQLPAGGYATPCTYKVDGRQYVAIAAGGAGKVGTAAGDAFVVYALP